MNSNTIFNRLAYFFIFALIVITTMAYGAVHQSVLAMVYVLTAVMVLLWVGDGLMSGKLRFSTSLLQIPIFGAAVYGIIQVIPIGVVQETAGVSDIPRTISLEPFATQIAAMHFFALLAFFSVSLTLVDSANRLRRLAIFLSVVGFGYAFFSVLQSVLSPDKIYGIYGRLGISPFGSFVNRNHFAAWIELAVALPLGLLFSGVVSKDKRLLYVTAVALMGVALVVSGSRGGLIAFVVEILFLGLITFASDGKRRVALKAGLTVGLLATVIVGSFFVGGESSLTRLGQDQAVSFETNSNRTHIWSVTIKMIGDSMPFGVGLGAFGTAYGKFDENSGLERVEQAHNDYLQALSDAGFVGAVLGVAFLCFLFQTGRRSLRVENKYRRALAAGAMAGITAVLIHSVFDFVLHTTAITLLFLTVLTVLVSTQTKYADDIPNNDGQRPNGGRRRISSKRELSAIN